MNTIIIDFKINKIINMIIEGNKMTIKEEKTEILMKKIIKKDMEEDQILMSK